MNCPEFPIHLATASALVKVRAPKRRLLCSREVLCLVLLDPLPVLPADAGVDTPVACVCVCVYVDQDASGDYKLNNAVFIGISGLIGAGKVLTRLRNRGVAFWRALAGISGVRRSLLGFCCCCCCLFVIPVHSFAVWFLPRLLGCLLAAFV